MLPEAGLAGTIVWPSCTRSWSSRTWCESPLRYRCSPRSRPPALPCYTWSAPLWISERRKEKKHWFAGRIHDQRIHMRSEANMRRRMLIDKPTVLRHKRKHVAQHETWTESFDWIRQSQMRMKHDERDLLRSRISLSLSLSLSLCVYVYLMEDASIIITIIHPTIPEEITWHLFLRHLHNVDAHIYIYAQIYIYIYIYINDRFVIRACTCTDQRKICEIRRVIRWPRMCLPDHSNARTHGILSCWSATRTVAINTSPFLFLFLPPLSSPLNP
jgi:hypothetical protein